MVLYREQITCTSTIYIVLKLRSRTVLKTINACLLDKKKASGSGFKKCVEEIAYLSCLAEIKQANSKKSLFSLKERVMEYRLVELEQSEKMEGK